MKTLLVIAILLVASVSFAETWKEKEIREAQERQMQLRIEQQKQINIGRALQGKPSETQCLSDCGTDYGLCLSGSGGINQGCSVSHGSCVARCYE